MKKIILVLFICFLLTGCNKTYEINLDSLEEKIIILDSNSNYKDVDAELDMLIGLNSDESLEYGYYDFEKIKGKTKSGISMSYSYKDIEELKKYSYFLNKVFNNIIINDDEKSIKINLSGIKKDNIDEFLNCRIIISAKGKLEKTNAYHIEKNKYEWELSENTEIQLYLQKDSNTFTFYMVIMCILVIFVISAIMLYIKHNKNNKL